MSVDLKVLVWHVVGSDPHGIKICLRERSGSGLRKSFFRESSYVAQVLFYIASSFQVFSFLLDCPDDSEILAEPRGSGSGSQGESSA